MTEEKTITRAEAMQQVATELTGPISFDEYTERVLALWPSTAKRPQQGIRNDLRYGTARYGVVFVDDKRKTLMPLSVGMRGVQLRHVVTKQFVTRTYSRQRSVADCTHAHGRSTRVSR